jgi:hypothetical protein
MTPAACTRDGFSMQLKIYNRTACSIGFSHGADRLVRQSDRSLL